jgi:UDP-N-acetylglucosamine transferase subunit ALG13
MEVIPFMTMAAYEHEISSANLVIMQAGGGGVLLALINQKIPILVPRKAILGEVIDDHQAANASNLSKLGHAIAVDDESEIEQAICLAMDMQNQKQNTREGNELSDAIARDLYKYSMHI